MFILTNSTLQVGLVGFSEAIALLLLAPLGGAIADRVDRRRLLQITQSISLCASVGLTLLTFTNNVQPWHIYLSVIAVSAASTFEGPARVALIPAMVSRDRVVDAIALINPTRELAILLGPSLAGVLIAIAGPGYVYAFDALTYATLVTFLLFVHVPPIAGRARGESVWASILEGFAYVRRRRLVWQLMSLDFSATFFSSYRVLLPTLARDILSVGASGFGLLSAAPAAGAILGSAVVFRLRGFERKGWLILAVTAGYGLAAIVIAQSPWFAITLMAGATIGAFDAIATTLRQAVVQLDTPDQLRGRVTSAYQMVSRGGPSLGQTQMGALAAQLGAPLALSLGAAVTIAYAAFLAVYGTTVKSYKD